MSTRVAKLVSVNVGMPRDVEWQGRTVHTGIWKDAVDGPRRVRRLNVDGDGQGDLAGHGGEQRAVYVYQLDSYRHWREHLRRDDFVFGQFGENFTVDGLDDDEVCIGDRYRIGSGLFEVTQPRVTCYRVGIRMNEPRMPALLVGHGRPGFYFRVLEEGTVQAGDDVVRVATGPEQMTVASVNALLYVERRPDRELLQRALRIPALSPGWQASLRALLDEDLRGAPGGGNAGLTAVGPPPAWSGFRPLRVVAKRAEATDVVSLELDADDGPLPPSIAGQFVTVRLEPGAGAAPIVRSYSLSGPPDGARYRISVKVEDRGAAGQYLRAAVDVGDRIDVAAPRGRFTLDDGTRPVVLVSAGVGVTPVLAMLYALSARRSTRDVWWLHGARNGAEHAFAKETSVLLASLTNAHSRVWYSRPGPDDRLGVDYDELGRITPEAVAATGLPTDSDVYLCGPPAFMDAIHTGIDALGVAPARVHTEVFGAEGSINPGVVAGTTRPPHRPEGRVGTGPLVSFVRTGLNVRWDDDAFVSILELAEACDVPVRWSCRTGVCHTCETGLVDGTVAYGPEPLEPPAEGNVLVCCSRPGTDLAVDL